MQVLYHKWATSSAQALLPFYDLFGFVFLKKISRSETQGVLKLDVILSQSAKYLDYKHVLPYPAWSLFSLEEGSSPVSYAGLELTV